jgi:hypothetical protein
MDHSQFSLALFIERTGVLGFLHFSMIPGIFHFLIIPFFYPIDSLNGLKACKLLAQLVILNKNL